MNFLKPKKTVFITFFLSAMIIFASTILMGAKNDTSVSISPANQIVTPYSTLSVDVYCIPSEPIKAYEFSVSFNPSVIQAVDVTEGDIFNGFTSFFNPGIIDNTNGDISQIYGLIIGADTVTDPGTLVHINFIAGINGDPMPYPEPPTNSGMRVLETYEIYAHSIIANLKPYTNYWHVKSFNRVFFKELNASRTLEVPLPWGDIDYRQVMRMMLAEPAYDGYIAIEVERSGDPFALMEPSIPYLREIVAEVES